MVPLRQRQEMRRGDNGIINAMTEERTTEDDWSTYVGKLRSQGEEIKHNLESRVGYVSLYDAIHACHQLYDLLIAIRAEVPNRADPAERDFLAIAVDLGLEQVKVAMSHGYEVHGQELDPIKYRLNVGTAIAQYTIDRLS